MMINRIATMREAFTMMLLEKLHPVLTYLYPDGSDALRARTLP